MNPSSQPENHLDNDKGSLEEQVNKIAGLCVSVYSETHAHQQYDRIMKLVDQYTQSKLKAFAGEVEHVLLGERKNLAKRIKAIKEKYQL